jgi:hypothetical protein
VSLPIWDEKAQRWSCSVCMVNVQSKYWRQRWLVMLVEELCRPTDAPWTWCFVERHVVKAAAFIPSRLSPLASRLSPLDSGLNVRKRPLSQNGLIRPIVKDSCVPKRIDRKWPTLSNCQI